MILSERLALIKARLKSKQSPGSPCNPIGKGLYRAATPDAPPVVRKLVICPPTRGDIRNSNFGPIRDTKPKRDIAPWVYQPDALEAKEWQPKPRRKPHALTRISEQLPMKLPKVMRSISCPVRF